MKQKLSIAARPSKPKNLSRSHYTTLGFGHVYPVYCEEMPNDSKVMIRARNFSRLSPQFLPNLGTIEMKLHAFYVPFSLVWNHYNNFQVGLPSWNSKGSQVYKYVPTLCDCDFTSVFTNSDFFLAVPATDQDSAFDFIVHTSVSNVNKYKFTSKGKYFYHVLCSLGYNFNFVSWSMFRSQQDYTKFNAPYSILPLLSFFKAYLDYFIPSQLQPSSHLHKLFNYLHEMTALQTASLYFMDASVDSLRQELMNDFIMEFVDELYFYYQNNYFTSAWMSPNAVVPGLNNIGNTSSADYPIINSIHQQNGAVNGYTGDRQVQQPIMTNGNGVSLAPLVGGQASQSDINSARLTADGLTVLQKFARFIKRSNFAGARSVERILSMFGIRITDFEAGMSTYLGSDTLVMQQMDVTVTGNSQEAGEMSGKGWFSSKDPRIFKCNADQYGFVFVTACLVPPSMFVDGVRRRNRHIMPLDFYNPDMDGTVMQAIAGDELMARNLYLNPNSAASLVDVSLCNSETFGYQLRYTEFKNSIDDVSGDFAVPRFRGNIDNFILPRRIYDYISFDERVRVDVDEDVVDYAYSPDIYERQSMSPVVALKGDDSVQFNRIFKDTDGLADPVQSVFTFDVVVNNSVIPLDTSAELDGRGKELEFESNGVHV